MAPRAKKSDEFKEFVLDLLRNLEAVTCKAMFGGHGLYLAGLFFGIIYNDQLFLKTNDRTRGKYVEAGMGPFRSSEKQTLKNYYEVPADVLESHERLAEWVNEIAGP